MNNIDKAVSDLMLGRFVIINDSEREEEADLVIAAKYANEKNLVFMMKHTSGIICVPMQKKDLEYLRLERMVKKPTKKYACNYTVPVDSVRAKTGVSAKDRALTIEDLVNLRKESLVKPGHTFPLIAKNLYIRKGHTEASMELIRRTKIYPQAAVISELMDPRTYNALQGRKLEEFAEKYDLEIIDINKIYQAFIKEDVYKIL